MTKDKKTEVVIEPIIKQKRGRKSKKDIQLAIDKKLNEELISKQETNTNEIIIEDNITCSIQETDENIEIVQKPGAK